MGRRRIYNDAKHWHNQGFAVKRRAAHLAAHPWCAMCEVAGLLGVRAVVADHKTPHRGDWRAFSEGPLQSLCASCHSRLKQQIETRGWADGWDADGLPTDVNHPIYTGRAP